MTIIPADKPDAAWNVGETLSDLLFWATHPAPEPLSNAWLDAYKDKLVSVTDSASRSFADDPATLQKLKDVRRLGFQFATLLCDRPKLSTISREEWTVPRYQRLFDELDELQTHFRDAGKEAITPASVQIVAPKSSADETPTRRKRNRTPAKSVKELTERQLEAMRLHGELNGNMTLVAKRMGVTRATAQQHYDAAHKKLPRIALKATTRRLATDKRGQADIAEGADRRR